MAASSATDTRALALGYAEVAAQTGWSNASLETFLAARGVDAERQREIWPKGVRSVARDLNATADAEMRRRWDGKNSIHLTEIVDARFADNLGLKRSVGRLARSDALHPIDTLMRTSLTAHAMIECRGGYRSQRTMGRVVERWMLVAAYSVCVLIWLADMSDDLRMTRRATSMLITLIGAN